MFENKILFVKLVAYSIIIAWNYISRFLSARLQKSLSILHKCSLHAGTKPRNIRHNQRLVRGASDRTLVAASAILCCEWP